MKLWHDDIRYPPDDSWVWARTNDQAKSLLREGGVTLISMDHDMGMDEIDPDEPGAALRKGSSRDTGYELAKWMVEQERVPERVMVHSWNYDGAKAIARTLEPHALVTVEPYEYYDPT